MARKRGIVKWFNRLKGFGMIQPDDGGDEVYVHYTAVDSDEKRTLNPGEKVNYDEVDFGQGPQARNVRK